jgi:hypothetical protein
MAEVRAIPSAVGAFEAQIFDTSKTYKAIITQEAAKRKAQSDQKKELDKMMANTYAAKGKGRLQDMPELEKQYNELQNYYVNNGSAIMKGGKEFLEFQKKRSDFIFEAEQANLRKQRDQQLSPFFKIKLDKEGLSDQSNELMTIFNLPYNDPRRKNYQYEGSDGQMHGIDELNVTDIDKFDKFNEIDLMKNIESTVKAEKITDLKVEPSGNWGVAGGYPILVTGTTSLRNPIEISQAVTGTLASKPDAVKYYRNMFNQETPESLQKASDEMDLFNSIYKGAGFGQVVNLERDGKAGISDEVEYALYRNLKSNLPQDLGDKISTQLANLKLGVQRMDLANRKWANTLSVQAQSLPIDSAANAFFDTNPSEKQIIDFVNSESKLLGVTFGAGGGTLPGGVKYIKPGDNLALSKIPGVSNIGMPSNLGNRGVVVYTMQNRVTKPEGESVVAVKDIEEARKLYGSAKEYRVNKKTGEVYATESVIVPRSGISSAERGRLLKYAYLRSSEAQKGEDAYQMLFKGMYRGGEGVMPEPGTNIQAGKGKGPSFKQTTTFSEANINK